MGSGDITYTPCPWLVKDGKFSSPVGVTFAVTPLSTAWTQDAGALAITMSAVRAPCAASDWYFENV